MALGCKQRLKRKTDFSLLTDLTRAVPHRDHTEHSATVGYTLDWLLQADRSIQFARSHELITPERVCRTALATVPHLTCCDNPCTPSRPVRDNRDPAL
jgi:hypothetical protein|eukprot:6864271-Prymnesium_polylepis.2